MNMNPECRPLREVEDPLAPTASGSKNHSMRLVLPAVTLALTVLLPANPVLIRETGPLSPEEELKGFTVPDDFKIQLFASEPMINKPINLAWDKKGRLWVSSTVEYPYAAEKERWADDKGSKVRDSRDAIKILEDIDGDGKADTVIDFSDGLNIPTGVVPWHRPEHKDGCIAWSIPNIWYFADTTGDGKADLREVLFGPMGYERDTHGMCSSFRLGHDGWVYATHGFNNISIVNGFFTATKFIGHIYILFKEMSGTPAPIGHGFCHGAGG